MMVVPVEEVTGGLFGAVLAFCLLVVVQPFKIESCVTIKLNSCRNDLVLDLEPLALINPALEAGPARVASIEGGGVVSGVHRSCLLLVFVFSCSPFCVFELISQSSFFWQVRADICTKFMLTSTGQWLLQS